MFVQKLNPLTGEADWVLVNDPGLGDEDDASADLVATSSYLDMLTDSRRNVAYHAALRRVIPSKQQVHLQQQQPGGLQQQRADTKASPVHGGDTSAALAASAAALVPSGEAVIITEGGIVGGSAERGAGDSGGGDGGESKAQGIEGSPSTTDRGSNSCCSNSGGAIRVLDIGTGTGLLAMMAARVMGYGAGATNAEAGGGSTATGTTGAAGMPDADAPPSAPVVACEVFPPMQNLARRVVRANGLGSFVRVINKRSDEMVVRPPPVVALPDAALSTTPVAASAASAPVGVPRGGARVRAAAAAATAATVEPDMYGKADVIVTEIFDSELLGEGMIPTMRHAVQHLLKEGGIVIPATSRVYGQVVQCPLMHQMTGLRIVPNAYGATAASANCVWLAAPMGDAPDHDGNGEINGPQHPAVKADGAAAAAAARVLGILSEMDARARAAFFSGDELYEVREMHIDLLYEYEGVRRRGTKPTRACSGVLVPSPADPDQAEPEPEQGNDPAVGAADSHSGLLKPLSEPFLVFDFDWLRPPPPSGRRTEVEVPITSDGHAHAVILWWQLGMVPEQPQPQQQPQPSTCTEPQGQNQGHGEQQQQQSTQALLLSTAPAWLGGRPAAGGDGGALEGVSQRWRDHWKQCWGQLADEAPTVHKGAVLRVAFEHDDLNIRHKLLQPQLQHTATRPAPGASGTACTRPLAADVQLAEAPAAETSEAGPGAASAAATVAFIPGAKTAREVLAAIRAEAGEGWDQQQLMPLLSWLGPQALLQLSDLGRLTTFGTALQAMLREDASSPRSEGANASGGSGGAEVVVVDGSLALGLLAATHPAVGSVTLLQDSNIAAANWLKAAAARLGVAAKIKSMRSDSYFKRLAAATQTQPAASSTITTPTAAAGAGSTAGELSAQPNPGQRSAAPPEAPGPLVLISEPYFSEFEQLVPWAHLKFWRDYDVIRGSMAGAGTAKAAGKVAGRGGRGRQLQAFPKRARLVAVAAALPELWRTRCALGQIEGLDLSPANAVLGVVGGDAKSASRSHCPDTDTAGCETRQYSDPREYQSGNDEDILGGSGSEDGRKEVETGDAGGSTGGRQALPILPYSIWQAGGGYEELSGREQLLCLDCGGYLEDVEGDAVLVTTRESVCHAIVLWMDFDLHSAKDVHGSEKGPESGWLTVSTAPAADGAPGPSVQGVYLLRKPLHVAQGSRLHVAAQFDGLDADVSIELTVLPPQPLAV